MNTQFTPTSHHTTIPFPAPHGVSHGPSAQSPGAAEPPAGGAPRGRRSEYSEKVIEMICLPIRRLGLSDSAAAEAAGMSSSSLSRWKREHPEVVQKLKQARQQCRIYHLEIVAKHAEADTNRGLRAAQWMLERVFPGDYARRMDDRFEHLTLEDRLRDRETRALLEEDAQAHLAAREAQREKAVQARKDWEEVQAMEAEAAEAAKRAGASEGDSQNVKNSGAAVAPGVVEPRTESSPNASGSSSGRGRPDSLNQAARVEDSTFHPEGDSHNVKNSGEAEEGPLAQAMFTASVTAPPFHAILPESVAI